MGKVETSFAALVAAALLTSCGGGSSSPTPTATATPTPSPSPTPTPTPTPTFSYDKFDELSGDQQFATGCVEFAPANGGAFQAMLVSSLGQFRQISYVEGSETWTVATIDGSASDSFGPAEFVELSGTVNIYRNTTTSPPNSFQFIQLEIDGQRAGYTRAAAYFLGGQNALCTFGVPTVPDDLPSAGTLTFSNLVLGGSYAEWPGGGAAPTLTASIAGGSGTISGDTATGDFTVEVTLTLREQSGTEYTRGPFRVAGSADVGSDAIGFLGRSDANASYVAELTGGLYGPQGDEAGFAMVITEDLNNDGVPDRSYVVGGAADN
ncbi:hypothetical protein [Aurantiacibacter rhizosphaerae]|uniref:hypothetical protein n=1 Tax=Aurantiacibacter rhizosphaerae TaxID=2691582 RepID=UPI0019230317|nr:hypothetical protein [Aurantiacibacter rhizosphaerae]